MSASAGHKANGTCAEGRAVFLANLHHALSDFSPEVMEINRHNSAFNGGVGCDAPCSGRVLSGPLELGGGFLDLLELVSQELQVGDGMGMLHGSRSIQ